MTTAKLQTGRSGRPPKFAEERRAVTITLPERTLRQLSSVDGDRARAIVKVTDAVTGSVPGTFKAVEIVTVAPGKALIVVAPCESLQKIPWLKLVEIAPARHLLTVPIGTPIESLEIAIMDLMEDPAVKDHVGERAVLEALRKLINLQRRDRKMSKAEILFVEPER